jgi:hypothetical protein
MLTKKEMDLILSQVEFEMSASQRLTLFKKIYVDNGIDDMVKYEKVIIKEILNSTDVIEDYMAEDVDKACKTILKSYKHFKNRL